MPPTTFQRAFLRSIAFAAMSLIVFGNVFGQKSEGATNDYEFFVGKYTAAINANPKNDENYVSRAAYYIKLKKFDEALQDYDKTTALNPKSNLGYIGRGYTYQLQGRYVEAVIELNKALKIDPKDKYALDLHRYSLAWVGKSDSAIDDYGKLIEFDPNNAEYDKERAGKYFQLKNYIQAVEDASKAIELDAKYADAYAVRSDSYCRLGKPKESNADIARYEALTGKKTGAVCDFCSETPFICAIRKLSAEIAAKMKTDDSKILKSLYDRRGKLYYENGDDDSALADFNKTEDEAGNVLSPTLRGDIYYRKGSYDEALIDFKQVLKSYPNETQINARIGEIYLIKGEYETAFKYLETVIFLQPGNSAARLGRAAVYLKRAERYGATGSDDLKSVEAYKDALEDFSAIIKNDKNLKPKVYLKRADVYEKLGEAEKAAADREKYRELSEKP